MKMAEASATTPLSRETARVRLARAVHINVILLGNRSLDQLEEICRSEDLTHSQYVALWTLCLANDRDAAIPLGAVSDGLLNRASDTTRLVDRLKEPNPTDRRGVLVRATAEGHRRFRVVTPKIQEFHSSQWANLTRVEARELNRLLGKALWGSEA